MVRPRLVEEGVPIYGPGSDGPPRRVLCDEDHDMHHHEGSSHPDEPPAAPSPTKKPMSSLQMMVKASGARIPPKLKGPRTTTNYEIGGGTVESVLSPQSPAVLPHYSTSTHQNAHHHHHNHHHHPHSTPAHHMTIGHAEGPMEVEAEHTYLEHSNVATMHLPSPPLVHSHHDPKEYHQSYRSGHRIGPSYGHVSHPPVMDTSYTIGDAPIGPIEKMVGVEDHSHKAPLVVLDGANVAHAYGTALAGMYSKGRGEAEPDATGIDVAVRYFCAVGIRVLIVLPQYWFRSKGGWSIVRAEHQNILNILQAQGLIVASPPADDDDAYALTIARREEARSLRRTNGEGPGFILSNDMFRDAQTRDTTDALSHWLNDGRDPSIGPGRISFSFADMGTMNDHGERILDFVPNPRHPLVIWIENMGLHATLMS